MQSKETLPTLLPALFHGRLLLLGAGDELKREQRLRHSGRLVCTHFCGSLLLAEEMTAAFCSFSLRSEGNTLPLCHDTQTTMNAETKHATSCACGCYMYRSSFVVLHLRLLEDSTQESSRVNYIRGQLLDH